MIQMPEAPPPPPHFGTHPSPQHLPAEMERLNLDHGVPPYGGHSGSHNPSYEGRFIGPSHQFDTSLPFNGDGKVPVTYEGWNFTKQPAVRPDQKETWALVVKTPMLLSQAELREQVTKQKKRGKSATDQLASSDMVGFKRKQVDRLIADRTRTDPDPGFEYKLGAIKLGQKGNKRPGKQTFSMQVILKRQLRTGLAQPSSGYDRVQEPEREIVDLTGAEEANYSQDGYSTGTPGPYAHLPAHGYPQPFVEHPGTVYVHDPRFAAQPVPHHGSPPVQHIHEQFVHHHDSHPLPPEAFQTPQMGQGKTDKKDKHDKHDKKDKVKVHQKKEKKHKSYSDSSSDSYSDADSFVSNPYTDQTPDTVYSGGSGRSYHKDKKRSSSHKEGRRDSRSHDRDRSPVRQVYRERRRKSPTGRSREGSARYAYVDYDVVIPERHHDRDQAYRASRKVNQSYQRERPSYHPRALSFDDDRHHRPAYGQQRRLQSYAHPHPVDLHAEKEELKWEIAERKREKLRERMERERAEQDRLELKRLERQRLEIEIERGMQERDRLDRLNRDRVEQGRFDRDRFDRGPYTEPARRYPITYDMRRDDRYY